MFGRVAHRARYVVLVAWLGIVACDRADPPFRNAYWDEFRDGLYVDAINGEPLFSSRDKFDSGTGWPSFTQPIEAGRVVTSSEWTLGGALRTEVRSHGSDSHLGHLYADGPPPTGLRYRINSSALRFILAEELESLGYRQYRALFSTPKAIPVSVEVAPR